MTTQQKKVVEGSKKEIRKEVNAIGKQNKKIVNQRDRFLIEKIRFRTISNKAITLLD